MKQKSYFECQKCGAKYPRWQGSCAGCGEWNTLEQVQSSNSNTNSNTKSISKAIPKKLEGVRGDNTGRISLKIGEWDNALGGGIVPGQVILLAGEPGVGKSTLLLKIAGAFSLDTRHPSSDILYFSGEESLSQISQRAVRLGAKLENTSFVEGEAEVDSLIALVEQEKPGLVLVDSIQTLLDADIASPAGSLAQVRSSAQKLTQAAKRLNIPMILVGHINKEGNVAGPKVLEHIVDTSLFLEGEKFQTLRFLRVLKNRFGPVDELGLFEMKETGLEEASDPGRLFVNQSTTSGSCLAVVIEGTRPMLVEVQALTLPCKYGYPKRSASGVNLNRLQTLLAVMEKRLKINLSDKDVYVSLAGGIKINEPALDLPLCLAVISAIKDKSLGGKLAAFGEVGLGGEVRPVTRQVKRAEHAKKLGISETLCSANCPDLSSVLSHGFI